MHTIIVTMYRHSGTTTKDTWLSLYKCCAALSAVLPNMKSELDQIEQHI